MRAIVVTNIWSIDGVPFDNSPDFAKKLEQFLKDYQWWPSSDQSSKVIVDSKNQIIADFPKGEQAQITANHVFTINNGELACWGIVERPNLNTLRFILNSRYVEHLQDVCQRLVTDLLEYETTAKADVMFPKAIEVYEGKDTVRYYGEILDRNRFKLVFRYRKIEAVVGIIALTFGLAALGLTSPLFIAQGTTEAWVLWQVNVLNQLATSAIVTFVIAWLTVLLHWFDLRRKAPIEWRINREQK